jgi:hypothetical protein
MEYNKRENTMDSTGLESTISKSDISQVYPNKKDEEKIEKIKKSDQLTNLTLYKKPVLIVDENENSFLNFVPNKIPFNKKYKMLDLVYECMLAPTKVYIGEDLETGEKVAIKEIVKTKLSKDVYFEFICNELAVSKYLSSIIHSVVRVYDYFEDDQSFIIVMELCDRPKFFEEMLEDVSLKQILIKFIY